MHGLPIFIQRKPMEPNTASANIKMVVREELIPKLTLLLNRGFEVRAGLGCSITALLCDQMGIEREYLENRIQTIANNKKAKTRPTYRVSAFACLKRS